VAQRNIEIFIGRLITDESFREAFLVDPTRVTTTFVDSGYDLTGVEIAALLATRADLWIELAQLLDPRLQRASFKAIDRS
jgi:hypothetical protein